MAGIRQPRVRAAWLVLVAFTVCLEYAAFSDGATRLPSEAWLQVALAILAAAACAVWLYGGGLRLRASRLGWAGVGLLVLFAAWTGASIAWSVAPDRSWIEVNRGIAYVLTVLIGLFIGTSLLHAQARVARALAVASLPVALYALGGKTVPGLHLSGVFDLDHAGGVNRLKAPLEYWNALALFCVTGLLPMLRLAGDPARRPWRRVAALLGVYVLVLVVTLTYSRGGVLALTAGLATYFVFATERVRAALLFFSALTAASVPLTVALTRPALTTDRIPLAQREGDAAMVAIVFAIVGVLLVLWGRFVIAMESRRPFGARRARRVGRPAMAFVAVLLIFGVADSVASGKLASAFHDFKDTKQAAGLTDPNRLLSSNSGNRWTWWQEAAGAFSDKPLAGWGAGSFPVTHKIYRRDLLSVLQPHSVPLQWLAETGLIGTLLAAGSLLALLATALARVRALPWAVSGAPPERGWAAALLAVAVAWTAHCFYDWDWDIPAVTLPMLFVLGVLAARPVRGPLLAPAARGGWLAATVVACVLVVLSAVIPAVARTSTESALTAIGSAHTTPAQLADAARDAELAARLNPLAVDPLYAASSIAIRRGRRDEARQDILRALARQPDSVEAWIRLAQFEFERGDRAGVRRASQRAVELDPQNPGTIALAAKAQSNSAPPAESATATGSPLPTQVPITSPDVGIAVPPTP